MSITLDRGLTIDMGDPKQGQAPDVAGAVIEKIFAAAQPGAVFGAPVVSGAFTVITACEVSAGGGFGSGRGTLPKPAGQAAESVAAKSGGGGAGGGASGRPIAAIVIGPDGVSVKPLFDLTKIALAGITALGAMLATYFRLRAKTR